MKKISPKRVAIGTIIGSSFIVGLVFGLDWWFTNPAFPGLWLSKEERIKQKCTEETTNQPYVSQDYYAEYFRDCLMRDGEKTIVAPPDTPIEGVG